MKKYTSKELGKILAGETMNLTNMWFMANKNKKLPRTYWLGIHLGFIAGMKLAGYDETLLMSALNEAQDIINNKN